MFEMQYRILNQYTDYGSVNYFYKKVTLKNMIADTRTQINEGQSPRGIMETRCRHRIIRRDLYLPLLDCDSYSALESALSDLRSFNLDYAIIESSPGRYWVLVDKEDNLNGTINFMSTISGTDSLYVKMCRDRKYIGCRSHPKNGVNPRITHVKYKKCKDNQGLACAISFFINTIYWEMSDGAYDYRPFLGWLREFNSFWHNPIVEWVRIRTLPGLPPAATGTQIQANFVPFAPTQSTTTIDNYVEKQEQIADKPKGEDAGPFNFLETELK